MCQSDILLVLHTYLNNNDDQTTSVNDPLSLWCILIMADGVSRHVTRGVTLPLAGGGIPYLVRISDHGY